MPEEGKVEKKTVTFQYKVAQNYALYSIAGVHGGLNAKGEIVANLFSERHPIPKRVTHVIGEDLKLVEPPMEVEATKDIIRNVSFGISLSPDGARAIGAWLIQRAEEYDKLFKKKADS